jgi:hypothetical protein
MAALGRRALKRTGAWRARLHRSYFTERRRDREFDQRRR